MTVSLKRNWFHAPGFFVHQLAQAVEQLGADARGLVGEVHEVPLAVLKDLEAELVAAVIRDERAVQGFDAALVAVVVARRAQGDGDLLRRMFLVFIFFYQGDIQRRRKWRLVLVFGLIHLFDICQRCHSASHQRWSHFFVFLELRFGLRGHGGFVERWLPFTVPAIREVIGRGRHVIVHGG